MLFRSAEQYSPPVFTLRAKPETVTEEKQALTALPQLTSTSGDQYFHLVWLLLPGEITPGSGPTVFTDASLNNRTITETRTNYDYNYPANFVFKNYNAPESMQIVVSDGDKKWGDASIYFDFATAYDENPFAPGSCLVYGDAQDFASKDWAIEFWFNMPAAPINDVVTLFAISNTLDAAFKWSNYYNLFGGSFSGSNDFPVRFNTATNKLWLGVVGWNSPAPEFDFPFVPNTWVHVAVSYTHRSGLLRVYRDGVRVAQVYAPSVYFPPPPPKSDPLFNEVFVLMHMDGNLNDEIGRAHV